MFSRVTFKNFRGKSEDEDTDPSLLSKSVVIKENRLITTDYNIGEYLGSGKFGEVKRCQEKNTGGQFAAKFVPIASVEDMESVRNEIAIMNRLRHPRFIQLYDAYLFKDEVVMVLELITGGELFERIIDESFDLNETRCIRFMNEILQGVEYMHAQGVLHLDLKPENILCLSKTSFKIKIIDFGLARFYDDDEVCVLFGTPEFVSPEVISYDPVSPAADMWSIGVICYVMLSGLSPFLGDSQSETLTNILRVTYDFDYPEFEEISEEARDFIRKLLVKDARKRLTACECLQHPWIKRKKQLKRKGTVSKKRLKHFVYRRKWQKAVNAIIALLRMGVVLHHTPLDDEQSTQISVVPTPPPSSPTTVNRQATSQMKQVKTEGAAISVNNRKERRSSIFGKFTSKRTTEEESKTPVRKTSNSSRRPSILQMFSRRGSTTDTKNAGVPKKKSTEQKTEGKHGKVSKIRFEPQNASETSTPDLDEKPAERSITKCLRKTENKLVPDESPLPLGKSHELKEGRLNSSSNVAISPQSSSAVSNLSGKPNISSDLKTPVSKSAEKPGFNMKILQRKVAPATGGIAAKIGFFSNLQHNPNPNPTPKGK